MSGQDAVKVFNPPNMLKAKVGGSLPKLDAEAIARAEKALEQLSDQFESWMDEELAKLEAAWAEVKAKGLEGETGAGLYRAAHDVKGLGATYQFPLVTRLAASLCKLIETPERRDRAPIQLVGGLLDAIRVAIRDKVRTEDHPTGRALAEESEAIVAHVLSS